MHKLNFILLPEEDEGYFPITQENDHGSLMVCGYRSFITDK